MIRGVWLGSSAANTHSLASVVQVGEVQGDWCRQLSCLIHRRVIRTRDLIDSNTK